MGDSSGETYRKEADKTSSQTQSAPPGSASQQNSQNLTPSGVMRPRSLYTAHTASYHDEINNFSVSFISIFFTSIMRKYFIKYTVTDKCEIREEF